LLAAAPPAALVALAGCALPSADQLPARQRAAASAPLVAGNEARLLIDGPRTHDAMFAAMARARDHINLQTYILDDGEAGERLVAVLKDRVAAGVTAQLIYDSVGSIATPREYFDRLREAGVNVCEFNPVRTRLDKVNNRDHRKILVVDGRVAFTGGINISRAYASGSASARRKGADTEEKIEEGWRDTQVMVEGPVVAQFQRLFLDAWALQDCGPYAEARYYPEPERRGGKAMRVVASDPTADRSEMYATLLERIGGARSRVWLTVGYFVPDPQTKGVLAEAARRGVDVRLVLPGFSDFWAPVDAGRSHYDELLAAGVRIYEWHEALMHAKTAVIDSQWGSIGSTNLDWRSFVHNYEADLVFQDAGFAQELEHRFRRDLAASVEIDAEKWRSRGLAQKLREWFARQWEYLL
jgi:cardiolipin synthase